MVATSKYFPLASTILKHLVALHAKPSLKSDSSLSKPDTRDLVLYRRCDMPTGSCTGFVVTDFIMDLAGP
jgi:hypothetical protein